MPVPFEDASGHDVSQVIEKQSSGASVWGLFICSPMASVQPGSVCGSYEKCSNDYGHASISVFCQHIPSGISPGVVEMGHMVIQTEIAA